MLAQFKMAALRDTLLSKSNDWRSRHSVTSVSPQVLDELDLPGIFVFKHRERQCFQFVGRAMATEKSVFAVCNDLLKASFEGVCLTESLNALAALLVVSMAADWDFYFISVSLNGWLGFSFFMLTALTTQTIIIEIIIVTWDAWRCRSSSFKLLYVLLLCSHYIRKLVFLAVLTIMQYYVWGHRVFISNWRNYHHVALNNHMLRFLCVYRHFCNELHFLVVAIKAPQQRVINFRTNRWPMLDHSS